MGGTTSLCWPCCLTPPPKVSAFLSLAHVLWMCVSCFPSGCTRLLVDVGANEGGFTRFAALRGFAAIGLEALARNAVYVRTKLLTHGLSEHAVVVNAAMWSHAGQLFELNDNSGNGQLLGAGYGARVALTAESNIIGSTTLDAVLQHDVYFLKMDVEGCEGRVVAGAACLLRTRDVRFIFFEFSAKNMQMVSGNEQEALWLLDELAGLGYKMYIVDCSHNIDAQVIAALPVQCVSARDKEQVAAPPVSRRTRSHTTLRRSLLRLSSASAGRPSRNSRSSTAASWSLSCCATSAPLSAAL